MLLNIWYITVATNIPITEFPGTLSFSMIRLIITAVEKVIRLIKSKLILFAIKKTPLIFNEIISKKRPIPNIMASVKGLGMARFIFLRKLSCESNIMIMPEINVADNPSCQLNPRLPTIPARKYVFMALVGPIMIGKFVLNPIKKHIHPIVIQVARNTSDSGIFASAKMRGFITAI